MWTGYVAEPFAGIVIVDGPENVPSFPSAVTVYVPEPIASVRVNVIVRLPEWPGVQPSRS